MSFAVENDVLNFTVVNRLVMERHNVLTDLGFEVLDLSQGKLVACMHVVRTDVPSIIFCCNYISYY